MIRPLLLYDLLLNQVIIPSQWAILLSYKLLPAIPKLNRE